MKVYTDGGYRFNTKIGGWGVVLESKKIYIEMNGFEFENATNNRMELTAVIQSLEKIKEKGFKPCKIKIYSDSKYVVDGITIWIKNWKKKEYKKVKNPDLWKNLDLIYEELLSKEFQISWNWVKAHTQNMDSKSIGNRKADELANIAMDRANKICK
jgi:ribonuclease HI